MAEVRPARVLAIEPITPSIKRLSLDTRDHPIQFRPGQWVDLHVEWEGEPVVGGYSITSTPARSDEFELAIKRAASHRATKAVHEVLQVGDILGYAGGQGGFTLREPATNGRVPHRLMIAGGIGITPIVSMIRHLDETLPEGSLTLLYSARGMEEMAFKRELDEISARRPGFDIQCFDTGEGALDRTSRISQLSPDGQSMPALDIHQGRIDDAALTAALSAGAVEAYVCGPPPMTEAMASRLEELGLEKPRIHFERWW